MTEERKLVTVLFADIVGSTAIAGEHDPELIRSTLDRTFDRIAPAVAAHGGTVEKFIGDAVMAVFGVPSAHDDDAERALRAAFQIREIVCDRRGRIPLDVRIGVNTGEVVARTDAADQRLVTGVAVNVAQRLQAAAEPGEIVCGELTRRLTSAGVRYGSARRVQAKGVGEIEAHPAEALLDAVPQQHRGVKGLRAPLIGRDREISLLREAYDRVAAQGAPSLVTVYGAAGSGKSRLTAEFVGSLAPDSVRFGRCLPYGEGITFYPLLLILRSEAMIDASDDRAVALAKVRDRVAGFIEDAEEASSVAERLAVLAGIVAPQEALPDVEPADLAQELRWALRRFVERRSAGSPFVLVFEDIHWAEATLLDLIEHLAEWGRGPFLVLCLSRPDLRQVRPTFGSTVPNALAITLAPLVADDTRRLVAELLAVDALREDVRSEVVARSEGNPLYVEEFLRMLIDTGRIIQRDGRWVAAEGMSALAVPPTLQGLITARLDLLPAEVKRVLQAAAVAGRLFSVGSVAAVGNAPVAAGLLEEAARRDVIAEADERTSGGGRAFRFRHVLFRDVAYEMIPKAERSRMHDRYGHWLEERLGERKTEIVELLAHHAERAFTYAHEIGSGDIGDLGERALDLLIGAGDLADERWDHHAALSLFERAMAVAEITGADAARSAHVRGLAVLQRIELLGRGAVDVNELEATVALARAAGPSKVLVRLLLGEGWRKVLEEGRPEEAERLLSEAVEVADLVGDPKLRVIAMHERLQMHAFRGDEESERRAAAETLVVSREAGNVHIGRPLVRLGRIAARHGRLTEARAHFAEAGEDLRIQEAQSKPRAAHAEWVRGSVEEFFGDAEVVIGHFRRGLDIAREAAVATTAFVCARDLADWLEEAGDHTGARAACADAFELERVAGRLDKVWVRLRAARACVGLGAIAEARAHLEEARSVSVGVAMRRLDRAALLHAEATVLAAEDRDEEAIALFGESLALDDGIFESLRAHARIRYARALIAMGRVAAAREQLLLARTFFSDPLAKPWRDRIDGLLRAAPALPRELGG